MSNADLIFEFPEIKTSRIILRAFLISDAEPVKLLLDDKAVAATTLNIPHPYTLEDARTWIEKHNQQFEKRASLVFAICKRSDLTLIGAIELHLFTRHNNAMIGYWIGRDHWNQGFCTEAVKVLISYSFETMNLNKIYASVSTINPASKRVLEKASMVHEGHREQHIKKWGAFYDTDDFGLVRSHYFDLVKNGEY